MYFRLRRSTFPKSQAHFPFSLIGHLLSEDDIHSQTQKKAWCDAAQCTDVIADNLVKVFKASRRLECEQFNQALGHRIETENAPRPKLVNFFYALEATPYWLDHLKIRIAKKTLPRVPIKVLYQIMIRVGLSASYIYRKLIKHASDKQRLL